MTDLFSAPVAASEPAPETPARDVYTPSRLNREARMLLERGLPALWIEGEISNLSRPSSGHWYFSLKDEAAQIRCAMFRQRNLLARFTPKDGMHVQARGRVSLYEQRGDYQFILDYIEEAGEGALRRKFEVLKAKLAAEGLFNVENKRPLPKLPRRIGVITSPTGAALRDILHVLKRRFCTIPVLVYPVQVQGAAAAPQIASAIRLACERADCDVLILARGGGSLEDLWAFNEEIVARAIHACTIPLISGVGHEVDFTIADFVADVRAPTPTGAAELVVPDCAEWSRSLTMIERRLTGTLRRLLNERAQRFAWLKRSAPTSWSAAWCARCATPSRIAAAPCSMRPRTYVNILPPCALLLLWADSPSREARLAPPSRPGFMDSNRGWGLQPECWMPSAHSRRSIAATRSAPTTTVMSSRRAPLSPQGSEFVHASPRVRSRPASNP
jgi:exodeoxyribonuclease VII large subunit